LLIAEIEELQDELSRAEGFKAKKLAAQIKHKEIELEQVQRLAQKFATKIVVFYIEFS